MRAIVIALAVAGCSYHPGAYSFYFWNRFPGTRLVVNCLDVAMARRYDLHGGAPVIEYSFGNRCTHHVDVDLGGVRVVARDPEGHDVVLAPYDPRGEIGPQPIDALIAGSEKIEYRATGPVAMLCADVGGIDATAPRTERWVCLDRKPEIAE